MQHAYQKNTLRALRFERALNTIIPYAAEKLKLGGYTLRVGLENETQKADKSNELMSAVKTAELLGVSPKTLANWRTLGLKHLKFVKAGSRVFYTKTEINKFIIAQTRSSTSEKGNKHA